jgi:hypothetical protein
MYQKFEFATGRTIRASQSAQPPTTCPIRSCAVCELLDDSITAKFDAKWASTAIQCDATDPNHKSQRAIVEDSAANAA